MLPYLQHELVTMDSVVAFLKKMQDVIGRFAGYRSGKIMIKDYEEVVIHLFPAVGLSHSIDT